MTDQSKPAERIVEVHHREGDGLVHVATVTVPAIYAADFAALEYAWRWTNNREGSWSRRDLEHNPDADPSVVVHVPLREHDGRVYGLRSSMVRDRFVLDGKPFIVDSFGFAEATEPFPLPVTTERN